MAALIVTDRAGTESVIESDTGYSIMEILQANGQDVAAICGGVCSCATCHVYVDEAWLGKLAAIDPNEDAMLGLSSDRRENSRLCCQITLSAELDGLSVTTPEFQF